MSDKKRLTPINIALERRIMFAKDYVKTHKISCLDILLPPGVEVEQLPMQYFTNPEVREAYDLAHLEEVYKSN